MPIGEILTWLLSDPETSPLVNELAAHFVGVSVRSETWPTAPPPDATPTRTRERLMYLYTMRLHAAYCIGRAHEWHSTVLLDGQTNEGHFLFCHPRGPAQVCPWFNSLATKCGEMWKTLMAERASNGDQDIRKQVSSIAVEVARSNRGLLQTFAQRQIELTELATQQAVMAERQALLTTMLQQVLDRLEGGAGPAVASSAAMSEREPVLRPLGIVGGGGAGAAGPAVAQHGLVAPVLFAAAPHRPHRLVAPDAGVVQPGQAAPAGAAMVMRQIPKFSTLESFYAALVVWFQSPPHGQSFHALESSGTQWRFKKYSQNERKTFGKLKYVAAFILYTQQVRFLTTPAEAAQWLDVCNVAGQLPHCRGVRVDIGRALEIMKTEDDHFQEWMKSDIAPYGLQSAQRKRQPRGSKGEQTERKQARLGAAAAAAADPN
jgi:hypothetical protein